MLLTYMSTKGLSTLEYFQLFRDFWDIFLILIMCVISNSIKSLHRKKDDLEEEIIKDKIIFIKIIIYWPPSDNLFKPPLCSSYVRQKKTGIKDTKVLAEWTLNGHLLSPSMSPDCQYHNVTGICHLSPRQTFLWRPLQKIQTSLQPTILLGGLTEILPFPLQCQILHVL